MPVEPAAMEILPALPSRSELPVVAPMVNADGDATGPKVMPATPRGDVLPAVELMSTVVTLLSRNVATSVLPTSFRAPGKVSAPVLQLNSVPLASHRLFEGVTFQVAMAACAGSRASSAAAEATRMNAVRRRTAGTESLDIFIGRRREVREGREPSLLSAAATNVRHAH